MPESFSPELFSEETRDEIRDLQKRGIVSSNAIAEALLRDVSKVGEGGRVVVSATEADPDKLVAVSRKEMSPQEAITVYYNQYLLRTLFPENFPVIYASYGKYQGKGVSATFRERITGRPFTKQEAERIHETDTNKEVVIKSKKHPFSRVIRAMEEMQIPIVFDKNERNYMVGPSDEEYFVDTINYDHWTEEDKTHWLSYMKEHDFSEKELARAGRFIDRLILVNTKENAAIK